MTKIKMLINTWLLFKIDRCYTSGNRLYQETNKIGSIISSRIISAILIAMIIIYSLIRSVKIIMVKIEKHRGFLRKKC